MLRAFIATTPPPALQRTAAAIREVFQPLHLPWRWVRPEQIHLTLRFLGDVPEAQVPALAQALQRVAAGQTAFVLHARALGCFPHVSRPRVLWIGLEDAGQALVRLNARLTEELLPLGFAPEERPLRPHLTLARAQNRMAPRQFLEVLHTYHNRYFGEFPVSHLQLFQSQLQRGGAVYTLLHSAALPSSSDFCIPRGG